VPIDIPEDPADLAAVIRRELDATGDSPTLRAVHAREADRNATPSAPPDPDET